MANRNLAKALVGVFLLLCCAGANGDEKKVEAALPGAGPAYSPWGWGGQGMQFDYYMMTLTQLNMTPAFTLEKEAKQKLQDLHAEWRTAQAKFLADHKTEFTKIGQEQMEAFKAKDQEKFKALGKQYLELYGKGPKSDEYVAKAKAILTPEQDKVVEESVKKAAEDRKAMMEKIRAHEEKERKEKPDSRPVPES